MIVLIQWYAIHKAKTKYFTNSLTIFPKKLQGIKCEYKLCRVCCRDKCYTENAECTGHKFVLEKKLRKLNALNKLENVTVPSNELVK